MKFLPILTILFLLTSCHQPKVATVTKTSSDGKTKVTIVGKKETPLDPFHVTLTVKSGDIPEGSLIFEIAASDLTDDNVRFDWSDPQHAIITITQTDDDKKIFKLSVSDTQVIVAPVL
jgi:hypothetical protein